MRDGDAGDAGDVLDGGLDGVTDLELDDDLDGGRDKAHGDGSALGHTRALAQVVGDDAGAQLGPRVPEVDVEDVGELEAEHDHVDDDEQREAQDAVGPGPGDCGQGGPAHVDGGQRDARRGGEALGGRGDGLGHEVDEHVHAGEANAQGKGGDEGIGELHLAEKTDDQHDQRHEHCRTEAQNVLDNAKKHVQ